ncbi:hypothetical protein [Vibrio parahaemolyticus]|uniref:hypothetical protein n=1 Tax=Vibrio parahaemolyticus TaxID=670 RepID=UPI0011EFE331|nr:hypothetical protein [Vibrio parahaemolyticus]KAB5601482.1 hypothetical protein F0578_01695 [Vibrio parahaemolyticus]
MSWLSWISTGIRVAGAVVSSLGGTSNANGELCLSAEGGGETYLGNMKVIKVDGKAFLVNTDHENGYYLSFTSSNNYGGGEIKNLFIPAAKDGQEVQHDVTPYFLDNLAGAVCFSAIPAKNGITEATVSFSIKNWSKKRLNFCGDDFGIAIDYENNNFMIQNQLDEGSFKNIVIQAITRSGDVYNLSADELKPGVVKAIEYPPAMDNVIPITRVTVNLVAPIDALTDDVPHSLKALLD